MSDEPDLSGPDLARAALRATKGGAPIQKINNRRQRNEIRRMAKADAAALKRIRDFKDPRQEQLR